MLSSKRGLCTLLILCLLLPLLTLSAAARDIPNPTPRFYVNDFANLLDAETKDHIVSTNVQLYKQTGAQVVVVTLPSLEGDNLEEYATALFRQYGIGSQEKNNGVLLLLALEDRAFRIEVGYGLEGALNDAKTGRIQDDYIIPYLKDDKWNEGIRNGFDAIIQEVNAEYDAGLSDVVPHTPPEPAWYEDPDNFVMAAMVVAALFGALTGKLFHFPLIANLIFIVGCFLTIMSLFSVGYALVGAFGCGLFNLIGWAITSPEEPGGSSSYHSSSYHSSSRSSSSSYSSRSSSSSHSSSHYSGGGGRSGGGGSSRKF